MVAGTISNTKIDCYKIPLSSTSTCNDIKWFKTNNYILLSKPVMAHITVASPNSDTIKTHLYVMSLCNYLNFYYI